MPKKIKTKTSSLPEEIRSTRFRGSKLKSTGIAYGKAGNQTATERMIRLLLESIECYEHLDKLQCQVHEQQSERIKELEVAVKEAKLDSKRKLNELRRSLGVKNLTKDQDSDSGEDEGSSESPQPSPHNPGRRGAPKGHRGASRKVPVHFHQEQNVEASKQCRCGCSDVDPIDQYDHKYIEDIPPLAITVTRLNYQRGKCRNCGNTVRHKDVLSGPPSIIGPNLSAHLTTLNQLGMTFRKLSTWTTSMLNIPVSPSGVYGIVNRTTEKSRWVYDLIGDNLPEQNVLYLDETGWKVNGKSGYMWIFCNKNVIYLHSNPSRAGKVPQGIIGEKFTGIVSCDFYAAYNAFAKTQRCLVHLMRDIKKERELFPVCKSLEQLEEKMWKFINDGLEIQKLNDAQEKQRRLLKLDKDLVKIGKMKVKKGKGTTLVKRIRKYHDEIIRFASNPDVEYHNNRAERHLRPLVTARKMSFGSNTAHGAKRTSILHSVMETLKLYQVNSVQFLNRILLDDEFRIHNLEELKSYS